MAIPTGPRYYKLLRKIFPEGSELTRPARRAIERQKLREDAMSALDWMRAAKIERNKLPEWYEELCSGNDPMAGALRAVGYSTFLDAIDGDNAARKLFFERYDQKYKPTRNWNHGGQQDNPIRVINITRRAEDAAAADDNSDT